MENNIHQENSIGFHAIDTEEVLEKLQTKLETGLSSEEAKKRLVEFGRNELIAKEGTSFFRRVIDALNSFVVILLIVAAVVAALLGDYIEAGVIIAIVVLNTILSVVQEGKAEEALAALKKMAAPEASVLRNNHRIMVPAPELVPGDVVFLEGGK